VQSEYLVNECGTSVGAVTLLAERFSHRVVAWQDAWVSSKIMAARCVGCAATAEKSSPLSRQDWAWSTVRIPE